jgi:hypothetical protein
MPKSRKPKKPREIKDDPRVQQLANCVIFAVNAFRNKPVFDPKTSKMETWHGWFKRALSEAGYTLTEPVAGSK